MRALKRSTTSIRRRFSIVFVLLILLPALALGGATVRLVRDSMVEQLEKEQLLLLQSIQTNVVDRHVQDMENALRTLSQEPAIVSAFEDTEARRKVLGQWELTRSLFPARSWIYFGSTENEILVSPDWQPPEGYDCRIRPWYRAARYADGLVWVEPYEEYITGELVMSAAIGIRDERGVCRGVLSIDTHVKGFLRLLRQDAHERSAQIVAVSDRGRNYMLNAKEAVRFDLASLPGWDEMAGLNNEGRYLVYEDSEYYATFVDVPKLRFTLVSLLPAEVLHEDIHPIVWTTVGIAAAFVGVSLLAGSYFSRHFIRNIEQLNRYMSDVESGDYRIKYCVSSRDEFYELNSRLNTMVHHLAASIETLEVESNTDALCGIRNRRFLEERLGEHVGGGNGAAETLSVILFDLDHFKAINDTFGHVTGDEVLRRVAHILGGSFPKGATVGRYGGEEFMVILPGLSLEDGRQQAERFRATLECQRWRERGLVVTVSGGVAEHKRGEDAGKLIQRADNCLYHAKKGGRNRVVEES